jgi:serine phosphatase RsbU (regulator of sigma subunit)
MLLSRRGAPARYAVAIVAAGVATALTLGLEGQLDRSLYPVYFAAVGLSAWFGGFGPALVTIALSGVAAEYFFFPPARGIEIATWGDVVELILFVVSASIVAGLTTAVRRSARRAERARARADAAQERLAFLAEASTLLAGTLDYERTLANVARLAVPYLADWVTVDMAGDDGRISRLAVAHVEPSRERWAWEIGRRYPEAPGGPSRVVRTGRSELHPRIDTETLAGWARNMEHFRLLQEVGLTSTVVVPMSVAGRVEGVISLAMAGSGRRYSERDLTLAEDLARRAAIAVENARLFRERSRTARTLQDSLLPPSLPDIPGVEVAARYRPFRGGDEVGGDFYDVFQTAGGAWAAVVGDVCGKGVEAAALTGMARYTIRAAAMRHAAPVAILSALNDAILHQRNDQRFCTVACAMLVETPEGIRVSLACGGHPAPFVLRAAGTVERPRCGGALLGVFPDPALEPGEVVMGAGDALVLFTDGLAEARSDAGVLGDEGVERVVAESVGSSAQRIADRLETAVLEHEGGEPRDDVAILVIRAVEHDPRAEPGRGGYTTLTGPRSSRAAGADRQADRQRE